MNEYELAKQHKKPINFIRQQIDFGKKHPYDTLQPSDPLFKKVWGDKLKKNEDKLNRGKADAELEYQDKKRFEKRMNSYDKVHKRFHF